MGGGLGRQRRRLGEESTRLARPTRPHFLQPHMSQEGSALDSILRWGRVCQKQVLGPTGAPQPWREVALLNLSPITVLCSVVPTAPLGPASPVVTFLVPVPFAP